MSGLAPAALVLTDPQIDFLSPQGVAWGVVGPSVERNHTVENIESLLKAARQAHIVVAISPHYYYPSDHRWGFGGPLETFLHRLGMFDHEGPLALGGTGRPGADVLPQYKRYLLDGKTIIAAPHKGYGPESDDLARQLRQHGVATVILAGMLANLCLESHLRALLERHFEVGVVKDATAAAVLPDEDGDLVALVNLRCVASALWSTEEAIDRM